MRKSQRAWERKMPPSITMLDRGLSMVFRSKGMYVRCKDFGLGITYHTMNRQPPSGSNVFCVITPISEKKAPSQSTVRNPKWIPTTLPPLFHSSAYGGNSPAPNKMAATTPMTMTGHSTPRSYTGRIVSIRSTSTLANIIPTPIAIRDA